MINFIILYFICHIFKKGFGYFPSFLIISFFIVMKLNNNIREMLDPEVKAYIDYLEAQLNKKQNTKYMSLHHALKDIPLEYR